MASTDRGVRNARLFRRTAAAAIVLGGAVAGCATAPGPDRFEGAAGPITWEVVDIAQSRTTDGREIRWDYTVVLKETAGVGIRLERLVSTSEGPNLLSAPVEEPLERRLVPNSELRLRRYYRQYLIREDRPGFGRVPGQHGVRLWHRFHGTDESGQPVTVDVRLDLDPSVGTRR